ncbi:MAG: hypothetical protein PV340_04390 [Wolbachia sp.]|nr:hypothetical protein [Wolbachia sp.]MDD9336622.1 hypothetical protein [Wolbachia sp.]
MYVANALKEGNGTCFLGVFNRIIYSLSCLEAKNNFTVEVNSQVYERMTDITEKFLKIIIIKNIVFVLSSAEAQEGFKGQF